MASKEKQTTRPSPSQPQGGTEDGEFNGLSISLHVQDDYLADRVTVDEWETIREGFKKCEYRR